MVLSILLFCIGLLISFNIFAQALGLPEEIAAREAGDAALQGQVDALQTQVDDFAPMFHAVGDTLPDGGIVFYVDDTGYRGLAAWPSDNNKGNWYEAKMRASNRGPHWRLPTKHELNLLFLRRDFVGGFLSRPYWSSTEFDALNAWGQIFTPPAPGLQFNDDKNTTMGVRAVRAF